MNRPKPAFWLALGVGLVLGVGMLLTWNFSPFKASAHRPGGTQMRPEDSEFVFTERLGEQPLQLTVTGVPAEAVNPPNGLFCGGVTNKLLPKLNAQLGTWELVQPRGVGYLSLARKQNAIGLKVHATYQISAFRRENDGTHTVIFDVRTWLATASDAVVGGREEADRLVAEGAAKIAAAGAVLAGEGGDGLAITIPWASLAR